MRPALAQIDRVELQRSQSAITQPVQSACLSDPSGGCFSRYLALHIPYAGQLGVLMHLSDHNLQCKMTSMIFTVEYPSNHFFSLKLTIETKTTSHGRGPQNI
jgi:hypothetical protein